MKYILPVSVAGEKWTASREVFVFSELFAAVSLAAFCWGATAVSSGSEHISEKNPPSRSY
jgi:hypothetical protein